MFTVRSSIDRNVKVVLRSDETLEYYSVNFNADPEIGKATLHELLRFSTIAEFIDIVGKYCPKKKLTSDIRKKVGHIGDIVEVEIGIFFRDLAESRYERDWTITCCLESRRGTITEAIRSLKHDGTKFVQEGSEDVGGSHVIPGPKFDEGGPVLTRYYDWDAEVIIPSRFTSVGREAFLANQGLTRVHLPESIESIGDKAFAQCPKLVDVNITESLAKLGQSVFMKTPFAESTDKELCRVDKGRLIWYFSSKTEWILPSDVTSISNYAFASCEKLKKLTLHDAVKRLTQNSFNGCKSLKTLVLAKGLTLRDFTPLMNSKITKVILSSGDTINTLDPLYFACFAFTEGEVVFDWAKLGDGFDKLAAGVKKTAEELLFKRRDHLGGASITKLAELLIRKAVETGKSDELNKVLGLDVSLGVNYEGLISFASSHGRTDMVASLLRRTAAGSAKRKRVIRTEHEIKERRSMVIKARFPDMRVYSYHCSFDVQVGDIVEPEGKRAGSQGVVLEVGERLDTFGSFMKYAYRGLASPESDMENVLRALRITEEEVNFDSLLESEE